MSAGLVEVHLHGPLADQFGGVHYFDIRTPREAVRALAANYPAFRAAFIKTDRYVIVADGDLREGPDAPLLPVSRELHLVPRTEGHGPVVTALIGPALIGALGATWGAVAAELIGAVIVSALLWGVSQLFFRPPDSGKGQDDKSESYTFSGSENVTQQGAAVPVIYGRCYVGSVVVSAGLEVGAQIISSRRGTSALWEVRSFGDDPPLPQVLRPDTVGTPPLVLMNLGTETHPHMRVGPEGWKHIGTMDWFDDDLHRTLDLFVSPDSKWQWDYWRGLAPYTETAFSP